MCAEKLGRLWERVSQLKTTCLAQQPANHRAGAKSRAKYSRAALRDTVKWAAAHAPAQLSVRVGLVSAIVLRVWSPSACAALY